MPELFRFYGFVFMFFSLEHEPIHIHVVGKEGQAKFVFDGQEFALQESKNVKLNDLKRIAKVIKENKDIIINRWNEYFTEKR
ncbi:MAG: DUF4160 domain-containing protein [Bacteroidales bacterium]|jgi:hypothetical protein|nr:DUF4160 domain-containing protein [Bacteroidales bacterium]MDY6403483.1 DUF4160 domain-containing protein [Bacteroidales bacterium]